ncbi:unnamed protein product [Gadus morhua 'NCC']
MLRMPSVPLRKASALGLFVFAFLRRKRQQQQRRRPARTTPHLFTSGRKPERRIMWLAWKRPHPPGPACLCEQRLGGPPPGCGPPTEASNTSCQDRGRGGAPLKHCVM